VADAQTIVGGPLPNVPWEDRPRDSSRVMWRYSANPIIPRDLIPVSYTHLTLPTSDLV